VEAEQRNKSKKRKEYMEEEYMEKGKSLKEVPGGRIPLRSITPRSRK
jgi:hypothetical protein